MNFKPYVFLDFETGSRNPLNTQPTQLAAVVIDGRTLELQKANMFSSEIKPILDDAKAIEMGLAPVEDDALRITGKTREGLAKAPELRVVWEQFVKWATASNVSKSKWNAPIMIGYNTDNFDSKIILRLCTQFGQVNDEGEQTIFNPIFHPDFMQIMFLVTENMKDRNSVSFDNMREWLGFSKKGAHDARIDVLQGATLASRYIKWHRKVVADTKWEGAFANENI